MKNKIISNVMSILFSVALLSGVQALQDFAFYVLCVMNALAWVALFCGIIKDEVAKELRSKLWLSIPSSAFQLYAMIVSGHPILAASSFLVSFFIMTMAFKKEPVKENIADA